MNDFQKRIRWINRSTVVSELRELADKIEKGGYVSDLTIQELEQLLSTSIAEKKEESSPLVPIEQFERGLHEFSSSIRKATSKFEREER